MSARTTVTPERHLIARSAINTAVFMVGLCAGKTPQQVAAEIASRVVHKLRAKLPTEAAQRETAR